MAIEIRQQGEAALYAAAGQAIGRAQKAEQEEKMAFQREQAILDIAERRRQEQASRDWELQKMMLNSQQDFAHQQRLRQVDLETEARAKEWEVQKMTLRSQMDFQQEEEARQKEYDEFLTTEKYINDKIASGELPAEKAEDVRFMNAYQHIKLNKPEITARLGGTPEYVRRLRGVETQRPASVSEEQWNLLTPEEQLNAARIHAGLKPRAGADDGIFTPSSVQKGLGILSTGSPESPLGLPLPTLKTKKEHEHWAERNWGPDWKLYVPEAIDVINRKFGLTELKPLSRATMQQFLLVAGGNIEQAKQLAKQSGYKVE